MNKIKKTYIIRLQDKTVLQLLSEKNSVYLVYLEYCIDNKVVPVAIKNWKKEYELDESIPQIGELQQKLKDLEVQLPTTIGSERTRTLIEIARVKTQCQDVMQDADEKSFKNK